MNTNSKSIKIMKDKIKKKSLKGSNWKKRKVKDGISFKRKLFNIVIKSDIMGQPWNPTSCLPQV